MFKGLHIWVCDVASTFMEATVALIQLRNKGTTLGCVLAARMLLDGTRTVTPGRKPWTLASPQLELDTPLTTREGVRLTSSSIKD